MSISPVLALHICGGTAGFLSGALAVFVRKGSGRHRVVGNVFVVSMLALAGSGVYMAAMKSQPDNALGGALTLYLVASAWETARRRDGGMGIFQWAVLPMALAVACASLAFGVEAAASHTGLKYGAPAGQYFFLGLVALLACVGDVRMLVRRTLSPAERLARHLWRMCFALFIAAGSIFLARQHLFPAVMRKTGVLFFLAFFPLVVMIFWLIRVRMRGIGKRTLIAARGGDVEPLAA
jgi:uncharacterized membrane protein